MSVSMKLKALLMVFCLFTFWGTMNIDNVADAQVQQTCGQQIDCRENGITNSCIPLATTLPPVDVKTESTGYGFQSASGNCGAKRCYYLFSCVCGPPLGASICYNQRGLGGKSTCDQKNEELKLLAE